jgi:hypothetical protein
MKMRNLYGCKDTAIIQWVYIYHMERRIEKEGRERIDPGNYQKG